MFWLVAMLLMESPPSWKEQPKNHFELENSTDKCWVEVKDSSLVGRVMHLKEGDVEYWHYVIISGSKLSHENWLMNPKSGLNYQYGSGEPFRRWAFQQLCGRHLSLLPKEIEKRFKKVGYKSQRPPPHP
jgi:frataxin-like iron-binding protein CyaY